MNLHFAIFSVTILFWLICTEAKRTSSRKMKVEQANGMFIVRHKSIEEPKNEKTNRSNVENVNLDLYGEWSPWSKCRKRCKQVRTRQCKALDCMSTILKEERDCSGHRCSMSLAKEKNKKSRHQHQHRRDRSRKFRVLYHLQRYIYSPWSEWAACKTRTCHTTRYRVCMNSVICKNSIIKEDALCYTPGSECEKQYKPQFDQTEPETIEDIEPNNQVTSNVPIIDDDQCGYASRHATLSSMLRIIGGRKSHHGRWPWMIAILNRHKQHFCGGTLVSPQFVITAAHCVKNHLYVRAGENNFSASEGTEQEMAVSEIFVHPEYDNYTVDNDIALLKLEHPLQIDDFVSPICLPSTDDQMAINKSGTILGWGKKRNTEMFGTQVLQEARVPIADTEDCKKVYENYHITENMVCAGYKLGRVDSCAGDSGGPLMFRKKDANKRNKWYLYGITSFGEGCGKKGKYGIYAKVPKLVNWIRRTLND